MKADLAEGISIAEYFSVDWTLQTGRKLKKTIHQACKTPAHFKKRFNMPAKRPRTLKNDLTSLQNVRAL